MPLRLNVGVSRKVGLPHYGSIGASCNAEIELPQDLLDHNLPQFHDRIRTAYAAVQQAVHDELARLQNSPTAVQPSPRNGSPRSQDETGRPSVPNEPAPSVRPSNGRSSCPPRHSPRAYATVRQVGALRTLTRQTGVDLTSFLREAYGVERPELLSLAQASEMIDQLKAASES